MRWAPHPVTLRQLQYLAAVAETRSFHGAAALCRVAQQIASVIHDATHSPVARRGGSR